MAFNQFQKERGVVGHLNHHTWDRQAAQRLCTTNHSNHRLHKHLHQPSRSWRLRVDLEALEALADLEDISLVDQTLRDSLVAILATSMAQQCLAGLSALLAHRDLEDLVVGRVARGRLVALAALVALPVAEAAEVELHGSRDEGGYHRRLGRREVARHGRSTCGRSRPGRS